MTDTEALPPTQYLVMEVLAARTRLGETHWTFPATLRPALDALAESGLLWWKAGVAPKTCQAFLTDAGREAALSGTYTAPAVVAYEDLLGTLWLHVPWHYITSQITTEQREMWADAIEAWSARLNGGPDEKATPPRWWRDA